MKSIFSTILFLVLFALTANAQRISLAPQGDAGALQSTDYFPLERAGGGYYIRGSEFLAPADIARVVADVYVVASGTNGDGGYYTPYVATDQTTVQAALTATPDGGTIFFGPGTYPVGSGVNLNNKSIHLRGAGKGATVFVMGDVADVADYRAISFNYGATSSTKKIRVSDISIDGNWSGQTLTTDKKINALTVFAGETIIERVSVVNCGNTRGTEGFLLSAWSQDVAHLNKARITDCDVSGFNGGNSTHIGIIGQSSGDAWGVIEGCSVTISGSSSSVGIGVGKTAKGVTIKDNTVTQSVASVGILHDTHAHSNMVIENNTVSVFGTGTAIVLGGAGADSDNAIVSGNHIFVSDTGGAIRLDADVTNSLITGNVFMANSGVTATNRVAINFNSATGTNTAVVGNRYDSARYSDLTAGSAVATALDSEWGNFDLTGLTSSGIEVPSISFQSTTSAGLQLNQLTEAERDALVSPADGSLVFNESYQEIQYYAAGTTWVAAGYVNPAGYPTAADKIWISGGATAQLVPAEGISLTSAGQFTFADGIRQTFNPNGTSAGLNVGSHAGDPSTPTNGDIWYDSTANELTARINGVNVELGAVAASATYSESFTILEPDAVAAVQDWIVLKYFPAEAYPSGVSMVSIHVGSSGAYPASEVFSFETSTLPTGASPTVIESITMASSGTEAEDDGTITAISADGYLGLNFDATPEDVAAVTITITYTVN